MCSIDGWEGEGKHEEGGERNNAAQMGNARMGSIERAVISLLDAQSERVWKPNDEPWSGEEVEERTSCRVAYQRGAEETVGRRWDIVRV